MTRKRPSGFGRGLEHAYAIMLAQVPSPWPRDYRRWYELTQDLLWAPTLPFEAWLCLRDEHARLGRLIRRRARGLT